jgi:hypothetical protein
MGTKMDEITVKSTSRASAECSDIILRETSTTRLVFQPLLIDNPHDADAGVKGAFLFQRKKSSAEWEDFETIPMSSLKGGEGYKLEIKSSELLKLFSELSSLYQLHDETGVPQGQTRFIRATPQLEQLAKLTGPQVAEFLRANKAVGSSLLAKLLSWAIDLEEPSPLVERLLELGPDALRKLNVAVGLQSLKAAMQVWRESASCADEEFWQKSLAAHSFVLEQVFSWPTTIVKGKAYVGGKSVLNVGGNIVDFLMKNRLTQNAALIEIKTPVTPLVGPEYRSGVYNPSSDLSGAVMQILNYKHSLQEQYHTLTSGQVDLFESFNPQCAVLVGNAQQQLDHQDKRKSFELYRRQFPGVIIITYDELFAKTSQLIKLLEAPRKEEPTSINF